MARSPVIEALANSHLSEQRRVIAKREADLAGKVHRVIGPSPVTDGALPAVFATFAQRYGVPALPCRPSTCAAFCLDHQSDLGTGKLIDLLATIAQAHVAAGFADPTTSWQVDAVMARFANVELEPPRSWTKEDRVEFFRLPVVVQEIVLRKRTRRGSSTEPAENCR
jgi:hypothetical protein